MSYLKRVVVKQPSDPWEFHFVISKSVSTLPDDRDMKTDENDDSEHKNKLRQYFTGYSGWDREYLDDNTLVIKYYVDSLETAIAIVLQRQRRIKNTDIIKPSTSLSVDLILDKNTWSYVDDDGKELFLLEKILENNV